VIFHTQNFDVADTGYQMTGDQVLDNVYGQPTDTNAWGMFGVVLAWAAFFRLVHFILFHRAAAPYLAEELKTGPAISAGSSGSSDKLPVNVAMVHVKAKANPDGYSATPNAEV
jgi:hypothetical protein